MLDAKSYTGMQAETRLPRAATQAESQASTHPGMTGTTDSIRDIHLSGHEPRYFPGLMARASRRESVRQTSVHESDETAAIRDARIAKAKEEGS